jgi:hypothetical protein
MTPLKGAEVSSDHARFMLHPLWLLNSCSTEPLSCSLVAATSNALET